MSGPVRPSSPEAGSARVLAQSEPDFSKRVDVLKARLSETIRFCAGLATWRNPKLAPRSLEPSYFAAVAAVARNREFPRASTPLDEVWLEGKKRAGRLLVYFPDAELSDGAAEVETQGFFDVFNCPPWETWVGFFRDEGGRSSYEAYLLAWVPAELVARVQRGIDVNPEACILWLSEADVVLQKAAPWLLEFHP